jgi:hypothetical protein
MVVEVGEVEDVEVSIVSPTVCSRPVARVSEIDSGPSVPEAQVRRKRTTSSRTSSSQRLSLSPSDARIRMSLA